MILLNLNFCVSVLSATTFWGPSFPNAYTSSYTSSFTCRTSARVWIFGATCSLHLLIPSPSGVSSHVSNTRLLPCTVEKKATGSVQKERACVWLALHPAPCPSPLQSVGMAVQLPQRMFDSRRLTVIKSNIKALEYLYFQTAQQFRLYTIRGLLRDDKWV